MTKHYKDKELVKKLFTEKYKSMKQRLTELENCSDSEAISIAEEIGHLNACGKPVPEALEVKLKNEVHRMLFATRTYNGRNGYFLIKQNMK